MKKKPKSIQSPQNNKKPKNEESPSNYRDLNASWQISQIDNDGQWGINSIKTSIYFEITEELLNELDNCNNDLYNAITKLNNKNFDSLNSFLFKLTTECRNNLTGNEMLIIVKHVKQNSFWEEIHPALRHFESKKWKEIEVELFGHNSKTKHHSVSVSKIIPEAQKRLSALKMDDVDELFSIRINGKIRIWGLRYSSYLKILWFDLEHKICPTSK